LLSHAALPRFILAFESDDPSDWLRDHGSVIVAAIVLALIAAFFVRRIVPHALRPAVTRQMSGRSDTEIERRIETLSGVIIRTAEVVLFLLALFTILPEFGLDIRPVLAGVGITGIALGLGAQSLVRDTLNGIFILSENQYARGDVVTIAGVTGTVEDVTLRRTLLRDVDGVIYTVPNSSVLVAANFTRDFAKVRVTVPVAPASDLAEVRRIADEVGQQLASDAEYGDRILTPPQFLRVDSIDANGVGVQVNGTVRPGSQWEIAGVLRARLLEAMRANGIKTPWG
jgi:small conductance mechanosensitive channel